MNFSSRAKQSLKTFHYWFSAVLLLLLLPCLRRLNLPLNLDWAWFLFIQWLALGVLSIFLALLLYLIGFATRESLSPVVNRFRRNPLKIVFFMIYFFVLWWSAGWFKSLVLTIDTIIIIELRQELQGRFGQTLKAVFVPGLYLFVGLLLVSAYNDIIVSLRFFAAGDVALNNADKWLLHGWTVSQLSHWALQVLPFGFFRFLEFVYFGMFLQVGAAFILVAFYSGRKASLRFVGAVLTAYYLSLTVFYLWPSHGPYYLCANHFSEFPRQLASYATQKKYLHDAQSLWHHIHLSQLSFDFFIAFPCMHITQPLIALWFLRQWRRIVVVLVLYDIFLVAAIVLLEWHYVVDVLAGVPLALLSIAMVDGENLWPRRRPLSAEI